MERAHRDIFLRPICSTSVIRLRARRELSKKEGRLWMNIGRCRLDERRSRALHTPLRAAIRPSERRRLRGERQLRQECRIAFGWREVELRDHGRRERDGESDWLLRSGDRHVAHSRRSSGRDVSGRGGGRRELCLPAHQGWRGVVLGQYARLGVEHPDADARDAPGACAPNRSRHTSHACAIVQVTTTNNPVYCWGSNAFGQLGTGSFTSSDTPVAFAGLAGGDSVVFRSEPKPTVAHLPEIAGLENARLFARLVAEAK